MWEFRNSRNSPGIEVRAELVYRPGFNGRPDEKVGYQALSDCAPAVGPSNARADAIDSDPCGVAAAAHYWAAIGFNPLFSVVAVRSLMVLFQQILPPRYWEIRTLIVPGHRRPKI